MRHIVWLAGAVTAAIAAAVLLKPLWMRQMLSLIRKGKLAYPAAGFKSVIGIIFLIFATGCRIPWIIILLGILMTVGPILFCFLPFSKIQSYLTWWSVRPVWIYRLWAAAALVLGFLIIWAGWPQ